MRYIPPLFCLLTVSCASPYPSSVPEFPSLKMKDDVYSQNSSAKYNDVIELVKSSEKAVTEKIISLSNQKYALGDVGVLGTLTSVIAAASGAVTTALYGGGVAIGSGAISQRYSYDTQMLNYQVTKEKINCMYRSVTELSASQYNMIIDDSINSRRIPKALIPYLYGVLNDLSYELQTQQSAMTLVTPDLTALTDLLSKKKNSSKPMTKKSDGNGYETQSYGGGEATSLKKDEAFDNLANYIMANIGLCKLSPQGRNLSDGDSQPNTPAGGAGTNAMPTKPTS